MVTTRHLFYNEPSSPQIIRFGDLRYLSVQSRNKHFPPQDIGSLPDFLFRSSRNKDLFLYHYEQ